jgi:hypothetical protein
MEVQPDFRDLLELFNEHQVEFMLVGGYALAFHGVPLYTGDMDLFVHASSLESRGDAEQRRPAEAGPRRFLSGQRRLYPLRMKSCVLTGPDSR